MIKVRNFKQVDDITKV